MHIPSGFTGTMKAAPNSKKIALATFTSGVELFDFDNYTGVVSNGMLFPAAENSYGLCFSPDSRKLYSGEGGVDNSIRFLNVFQYDLTPEDEAGVFASKTLVDNSTSLTGSVVFDIQQGPDGKLYVARNGQSFLDVINEPNEDPANCDYRKKFVDLGDRKCEAGLPNALKFPTPISSFGPRIDTTLCLGDELIIDATIQNAISYLWNDNSTEPIFTAGKQGLFWVKITSECGSIVDTFNLEYKPGLTFFINDTTICEGDTVTLSVESQQTDYMWSNNSDQSSIRIHKAGTYWVEASNSCGTKSDTMALKIHPKPQINLGNDTLLCLGAKLSLDASYWNAGYLWNNGSSSPIISASDAGIYWVEITSSESCKSTDSIEVKTEICDVILNMPNVFTPNADGKNDLFHPNLVEGISTMNTQILNRWGNIIFETDNLAIDWDGGVFSEGTCFWIVEYSALSGQNYKKSGVFTLIK